VLLLLTVLVNRVFFQKLFSLRRGLNESDDVALRIGEQSDDRTVARNLFWPHHAPAAEAFNRFQRGFDVRNGDVKGCVPRIPVDWAADSAIDAVATGLRVDKRVTLYPRTTRRFHFPVECLTVKSFQRFLISSDDLKVHHRVCHGHSLPSVGGIVSIRFLGNEAIVAPILCEMQVYLRK
jgi:hypothetical protein